MYVCWYVCWYVFWFYISTKFLQLEFMFYPKIYPHVCRIMEPTSWVLQVAGREPPLPRQARRITMPQLGETKAATWEQKENGRLPSKSSNGFGTRFRFVLFDDTSFQSLWPITFQHWNCLETGQRTTANGAPKLIPLLWKIPGYPASQKSQASIKSKPWALKTRRTLMAMFGWFLGDITNGNILAKHFMLYFFVFAHLSQTRGNGEWQSTNQIPFISRANTGFFARLRTAPPMDFPFKQDRQNSITFN